MPKQLSYVVRQVQVDLQDYSASSYQRILQFGVLGMRDLKLHVEHNVSVCYLTPNDALVANLPLDFYTYVKIGVVYQGQIYPLGRNDNLVLVRTTDNCGTEVAEPANLVPEDETCDFGWSWPGWFNNGLYNAPMYGATGGDSGVGFYRLDYEMNRIQFANISSTQIILEYISDGTSNADPGGTIIPTDSVEVIRKYIHWNLVEYEQNPTKSTLANRQMKKDQYYYARNEYKLHTHLPTAQEFLDESYASYNSSIKR